jgi:hypothetical protein
VSGRIVASILTDRDVDDASQVEPLLDQIAEPVELFLGDGGYDRTGVYTALDERHPDAMIVVPPRVDAMDFGAEIREWSDFALSRRGQAIRRETGMPRPVMMFSTLQATLASVFCVGRVRGTRSPPLP